MGQSLAHAKVAADHRPGMGLGARAGFALVPLAALVGMVMLLARFELPLAGAIEWVPALGISLAWRIDGLAALMLLMITGVGSAVFVYAGGYLAGHPGQRKLDDRPREPQAAHPGSSGRNISFDPQRWI
ncbi:MAG TPA: hypothetical protein PKC22_07480 [Rhodocyclaceae bacterium]|nr:hypothetical protein [Rhodocyclaceae bacterium]